MFWTLSWPFSCDYNFWLRDLKFFMCIKNSINKTCWKNGKDLSNAAPKIKLWNHTKKTHFPVFAKNFRRPCMKLKKIFCQFPNPWTLRVSGMGGYNSKCEKKSKSLHPTVHCLPSSDQWAHYRMVHCYKPEGEIPVHTHDDAGRQWSTTGKYFPYEREVNTSFAPAVFNISGIFSRYTAWKIVICEHRMGSNPRS